MSEQQRLLVAIALSIMIISGWQMLMSKTQPPAEIVNIPLTTAPEKAPGEIAAPSQPVPEDTAALEARAIAAGKEPPIVAPKKIEVPEIRHEFNTSTMTGEITNKNGLQFTGLELKKFKERLEKDKDPETGNPILPGLVSLLTGKEKTDQWQGKLVWQLGGVSQPEFVGHKEGDNFLFKTVNSPSVDAVVEIAPRAGGYAFDYRVKIQNNGSLAAPIVLSMELGAENIVQEAGFGASQTTLQGICAFHENIERQEIGELEDGPWVATEPTVWAGIDLQYFVLGLIGSDVEKAFSGPCRVSALGKILILNQEIGKDTLNPGQVAEFSFTFYAGPKRDEQLMAVSEKLTDIIDYDFIGIPLGFLARPMVYLLNLFYGFSASWGLAIVLLTLTVKGILFPVTYKSVVSMRKMQLIKPELDKIKARWPDDRERQQQEQLKIFKEKGINPLGGCLPMLLQMPVWVALYRMLWSSVDLYQQPFLWLIDLTAKEPFPLLAIGIGILTFVQQKTTPTSADSQQAKIMMMVMPFMLTFFMLALPSGLVLYIFVNSVLTIIQTLAINKRTPAL